jgi:hypothetical protein
MAKKTDTKSNPVAPADETAKPAAKSKPVAAKAATVKPVAKKAAPAKLVAEKPVVAKPVAAKAKPAAKTTKPKAPAYTRDDVALRAYFIAEKRQSQGLPGDEHQDWVEAERQLAAESKSPKKAVKA